MKKFIDLRSDTVTKPSSEMRKAMYEAEVGDDVYGEDPTVTILQSNMAELLGKEAALFVPSGTMANQICLNVLTNPGDEVICDRDAHIFQYESGSPAALSGLQLSLIDGVRGIFTPEQVEPLIRPTSAYYMARTRVIEIENTHNRAGGTINPIENIKAISALAKKYNLYTHLDGARIWNASVVTNISPAEYASHFDSVSVCLSKGLGAPIGSVLAGNKDFVKEAFRIRKAWGGGMRQVGVIAAAGLYAVQNNISQLKEDHEKAKVLAEGLSNIAGVNINMENVETNILMFIPKHISIEVFQKKCKETGLLLGIGKVGEIRAVTHMNVSFEEISEAVNIIAKVLS
ncbi:MAG: aromatic amino acid beta-eliminating lyase/threonine aldolase [Ignavibacteria bacterium]|nr:MAG: aromatic amino acid beta-eliminating lyase/threonine aldolase [Ignavibacteria bacterium]KAF0161524.1 MAG: aromatic amino acid beta-eliminating lyase/threonine aldolase [Ignavibacteria bacterium]